MKNNERLFLAFVWREKWERECVFVESKLEGDCLFSAQKLRRRSGKHFEIHRGLLLSLFLSLSLILSVSFFFSFLFCSSLTSYFSLSLPPILSLLSSFFLSHSFYFFPLSLSLSLPPFSWSQKVHFFCGVTQLSFAVACHVNSLYTLSLSFCTCVCVYVCVCVSAYLQKEGENGLIVSKGHDTRASVRQEGWHDRRVDVTNGVTAQRSWFHRTANCVSIRTCPRPQWWVFSDLYYWISPKNSDLFLISFLPLFDSLSHLPPIFLSSSLSSLFFLCHSNLPLHLQSIGSLRE